MIISLVAVLGLQGMEQEKMIDDWLKKPLTENEFAQNYNKSLNNKQLAVTKDEAAFRGVFTHCINSNPRVITFCCFKETNNKKEIDSLTTQVIKDECEKVGKQCSVNFGIHCCFNPNPVNQMTNRFLSMSECMVYNIDGSDIQNDLNIINRLTANNKKTSVLFTGTSSAFESLFTAFEAKLQANAASIDSELAPKLRNFAKELLRNRIEKCQNNGSSFEELANRADKISSESEFSKFNNDKNDNNKSEPGYFSISAFTNFIRNHPIRLVGGLSLAALFAYCCYKVSR